MDDGGIRFIESEVLELSLVTIPANADATIQTIKNFDRIAQQAAPGHELERDPDHEDARRLGNPNLNPRQRSYLK